MGNSSGKAAKDKCSLSSFSLVFISLSPSVSPSVTCPPLHKLCKMRQSSLQTNTTQADALSSSGWCYPDAGFHCETLPCNKLAQIHYSTIAILEQIHIALFNVKLGRKFANLENMLIHSES